MSNSTPIPEYIDRLATQSVDAAFRVHKTLGPGLLESVYFTCMEIELRKRGFEVLREVGVAVVYEGHEIESAFRIGLVVNNSLIIEVKASTRQHQLHLAQLLTYMKLAHKRLGLLINFNVPIIKEGIQRIAL